MTAMPWFKLYRDIASSPKLFELEARVGEAALAHLVKFWCNVAAHRSSGEIDGLSDHALERWADWRGDRGAFIAALRETGFLEGTTVRGWAERQDSLVSKFEADAARPNAEARAAKKARTGPRQQQERGPDRDPARGPDRERRGEENREEDPDLDHAAAPPSVRPLVPILGTPEPLGPYGEVMPTTMDGILAFEHDGKTLKARWETASPELGPVGVRTALEAALAYRSSLEGQRRRQWGWPLGFIHRTDDWMRRARIATVDEANVKARASKNGAHITAPGVPVDARREALKRYWSKNAGTEDLPPFHVWIEAVERDGTADKFLRGARAPPGGGDHGSGKPATSTG